VESVDVRWTLQAAAQGGAEQQFGDGGRGFGHRGPGERATSHGELSATVGGNYGSGHVVNRHRRVRLPGPRDIENICPAFRLLPEGGGEIDTRVLDDAETRIRINVHISRHVERHDKQSGERPCRCEERYRVDRQVTAAASKLLVQWIEGGFMEPEAGRRKKLGLDGGMS